MTNFQVVCGQLFKEAADLLWRLGSLPETVLQEFKALGAKAKAAAAEATDAEAMLGDIPEEFLDPIQVSGVLSSASAFKCLDCK